MNNSKCNDLLEETDILHKQPFPGLIHETCKIFMKSNDLLNV